MTQLTKQSSRAGSRWPIVVAVSVCALFSATTIVVAGPSWASRVLTGAAAAVSQQFVHVSYRPNSEARPTVAIDDYIQGLEKAVPGAVPR
jgi:hypothetical protein